MPEPDCENPPIASQLEDTHPSPKDRFRLVAALGTPACAPRPGEVWSLFRSREALMQEMMKLIEKNIAGHRQRGDPTLQAQKG